MTDIAFNSPVTTPNGPGLHQGCILWNDAEWMHLVSHDLRNPLVRFDALNTVHAFGAAKKYQLAVYSTVDNIRHV